MEVERKRQTVTEAVMFMNTMSTIGKRNQYKLVQVEQIASAPIIYRVNDVQNLKKLDISWMCVSMTHSIYFI